LRKDNLPEFQKQVRNQNITTNAVLENQEVRGFSLNKNNEKEQIVAALNQARGNKTVAARLLQIDRKTLYNKMHLYGIEL
jgi:transcriptional regulator of acetoin/glycerol metabolism